MSRRPDVFESHVRNGVKVSVAGYKRGLVRDWYVLVSEVGAPPADRPKTIIVRGEEFARKIANAAFKATATSSDLATVYEAAHAVAFGEVTA